MHNSQHRSPPARPPRHTARARRRSRPHSSSRMRSSGTVQRPVRRCRRHRRTAATCAPRSAASRTCSIPPPPPSTPARRCTRASSPSSSTSTSRASSCPTWRRSGSRPTRRRGRFTLVDNATFHNGEKFTSADVVYTFDRILDPDTASAYAGLYAQIDSVEAVDDTTVVFHLKAPFGPFLTNLATNGQIVNQKAIESTDPAREPVGTGPFIFVEWVQGDHITRQEEPGLLQRRQAAPRHHHVPLPRQRPEPHRRSLRGRDRLVGRRPAAAGQRTEQGLALHLRHERDGRDPRLPRPQHDGRAVQRPAGPPGGRPCDQPG